MNEQFKKYLDPVKKFWTSATKKKRIIICSVLAGIVFISIVVCIILNMQPLVVLYPGLDHDEAVEVMNELKERDVTFKEDNGTIYVPKDKENSLRMDLSNEGHPKTALNYDFFTNNTDIMSTDFEKKTIEKYQLNERLGSVIKTLDGVKAATVTISIPDENSYAWDEDSSAPSASVTVTLASGKTLQASQVNGIKQLVAKSVPNLKVDDVAVVDTATGEELSAKQTVNQIDISEFKRTIEKEFEKDIEKGVLKVLTPVFGTDNVRVSAKSTMDVDKKVQEIITYKPSTSDNKGVIQQSETDRQQQLNGTSSGAAVGTQTNTETTTYPGVTVNGNVIYTKDSQSYQYLVSQVKEQIQGDAANLKDLTISVVINKAAMDATQKEQITKLAANAGAVDVSKVAVYSAAFATKETVPTTAPAGPFSNLNQVIIFAAAGVAALILIIIIFAVVISSSKRKKRREAMGLQMQAQPVPDDFYQLGEQTTVAGAGEEGSEDENGEDLDNAILDADEQESDVDDAVKAEIEKASGEKLRALKVLEKTRAAQASKEAAVRQKIQDFTSQNPEIAAQLIRTLLRGDELGD